ncbi:virulence-associated E family protein [Paenibacillus sp. MAH-36]|uniref:Virulence-associated E family protein n=1 Tax=Paenibacillus violae TaxID=3077234 RepID=A0ABU3R7U1_9BACL|nr:virulence-associated E family protein [Paenibacillus sp. PFR10]MDU0200148.1 virulence-associated E family protein [Paenibacillus sp. PFR10]
MLNISYGRNRGDKNWKPKYGVEWTEFVKELRNVRRTAETMREYDAMDNDARSDIKDGPSFVGGEVNGGRRLRESVSSRCLITLDADHVENADDFIFDVELNLDGYAYYIYSTHSHRAKKAKFRLVLPIDREASPDEYAAACRKLADDIGMHYFDKTTFQVHRLMYFPSCSKDAKPVGIEGEGDPLSLDGILGRYDDWRDASTWPRAADEKTYRESSKKMEDPREKEGLIGEFCRQYSITQAIAEFLPEVYEETAYSDRFTYIGASSSAGLIVYDDDTFAYSQHESDPANGRGLNAFDLVRIHLFGEQDQDAKAFTNHTKLPSFQAMQEYASKIPGIKSSMLSSRLSAAEDFKDDEAEIDDDAWLSELDTDPKNPMIIKPTAGNVELILSHGAFKGVLAYDEFANVEVIRGDLPWRKRLKTIDSCEPWLSADDDRRDHWVNKVFNIDKANMIKKAFTEVTRSNAFNPVKDFVESAIWDGLERAETIFIRYLGADDTHYVRQATRKILLAAVTRVYKPGTKFDQMLVLVGPQGAGKSSLLARLGGKWFSDGVRNFDSKEAGEHLQRGWIFEIGELSAMKKSEVEEVKAFISKTEDRYRQAYDRQVSEFPRKGVFFGTTNTADFLQDKTGNRRFWPIDVNPEAAEAQHWEEFDEHEVSQVWAEVLEWYKSGEGLMLDAKAKEEAEANQEEHMEEDPREGVLHAWLNSIDEDTGKLRDVVCAVQVWQKCFGNYGNAIKPWEAKDVSALLQRAPGWKKQKARRVLPEYGKQTVFKRTLTYDELLD